MVCDFWIKTITNSPPQGMWDIKKEASRFLKESEAFMIHKDYVGARPLIETAYSLNPVEMTCVEALIEILNISLNHAIFKTSGPFKKAQTAYRVIELCAIQLKRGGSPDWALSRSWSITPTPDGKKLFFICEQLSEQLNPNNLRGFWKMDLESGKFKHIWRGGSDHFHNIVPGEESWLIRRSESLIFFNPYLETGKVIVSEYGYYKYIKVGPDGRKLPSIEKVYVPAMYEQVGFWGTSSAL